METKRFKSLELTDDLLKSVDSDSLVEGYLDTSLPRELASSSSSLCLADLEETAPPSTPTKILPISPHQSNSPKPNPLKGTTQLLTSTPQLRLKSWLHQTLNKDKIPQLGHGNKVMCMDVDTEDLQKLSLPVPTMDRSIDEDDTSSVFSSISAISFVSVASSTRRELSAMFDNYERTYRYKFSRFQRQLLQKEVNSMKSKASDMKCRDERLRQRFEDVQKRRRLIDCDTEEEEAEGATAPSAKKKPPLESTTVLTTSQPPHHPSRDVPGELLLPNVPIYQSTDEGTRPIPPPRKKRNKELQKKTSAIFRSHPYTSPRGKGVEEVLSPARRALGKLSLNNNSNNAQISPRRELLQLQTLQQNNDAPSGRPSNICRRAKSFYSHLDMSAGSGKKILAHRTLSCARPRRPAPAPPSSDHPVNTSSNNNITMETDENARTGNSSVFSIFEISKNNSTMFDSGCASNSTADSTKFSTEAPSRNRAKPKRRRSLRRSLSGNKIHPIIAFTALASGVQV